ncbi:GDP-fucose transporter 1 [Balamuthia mandrillaris]
MKGEPTLQQTEGSFDGEPQLPKEEDRVVHIPSTVLSSRVKAKAEKEEGKREDADEAHQGVLKRAQHISKIAAIVSFYVGASMALVLMNKYVLSYSAIRFPYPLFLTWFQLLVAFLCLFGLGQLGQWDSRFSFVPPFEFTLARAKIVMPLTCVYVGMLATNNLCLNYVEVSFFQIARSLSVCFQLLFTNVVLKQRVSMMATAGCMVVIAGFLVGSEGEESSRFSVIACKQGLCFGILSSLFVAMHGLQVKRTLSQIDHRDNEWLTAHYNTLMSLFLLLPLILLSGEPSGLLPFLAERPLRWWSDSEMLGFWAMMTLTGLLGFSINLAVFMMIKHTSPLTSVIVGATKSCLQSLLSILIFQNPVPFLNGLGLSMTIVGAFIYSFARYNDMQAQQRSSNASKAF